jgi:hypothetical protein
VAPILSIKRIRIWWYLRKLKRDRVFLLKFGNDPRSQELLSVAEAEIARLRVSQIKLRYPHIFKDEAQSQGGSFPRKLTTLKDEHGVKVESNGRRHQTIIHMRQRH